jgi:hypothetical protein
MPIYEVAILQKPTQKEIEDGTGVEKLLFGPKHVVARDGQAAAIIAVTGADAPKGLDMSRSEVLIRPFADDEEEA